MAITTLDINSWQDAIAPQIQQHAITALENGQVVYLPSLPFELYDYEQVHLTPDVCDGRKKNVSFDLKSDQLGGLNKNTQHTAEIGDLMRRYALSARQLLNNLFPHYQPHVQHARTSYRPVEIAGRKAPSYRKDDTLLHVDAFPSTPTQGKRILRIFSNVNPHGQSRIWRVGEEFANVVHKFAPQVPPALFGSAAMQKLTGITRGYRTAYDHFMLKMHHAMKADQHYQKNVSQQEVHFPPGSTWVVFTDQVSHAAMAGQYVFEQTFYLPVHGQYNPTTAPLKVLEKFLDRKLI